MNSEAIAAPIERRRQIIVGRQVNPEIESSNVVDGHEIDIRVGASRG
jgi:hypothetical protein